MFSLQHQHMFTLFSAPVHCFRFAENIPQHITPKSGFESFAEYTQCLQEGTVRLLATCDIQAGDEIYVHVRYRVMHVRYSMSCTVT